ncbi:metalloregulator ArsR/SmtB family transcription factor [Streptomyces sp. SR27]|uniref:ArsR/SmtB family transcription factor n=1 Tax=Streptomyces sp. SR27 TaxID=3076630 RepID=UPI00295BD9FF|nr:metalloregulator ArsR/SmtB family transcription factor [Streptomyces sp. SR27]MDV9188432.1 metalloregulator ArsR/SmtB family transcription factor [Streptomyces sp. SR27]
MATPLAGIPIEDVNEAHCVPCAPGRLIDRDEIETLTAQLKAMADQNRLQIIHLIDQAPAGELCVCDLTVSLDLAQPTVSRHLKILTTAGLLRREQRGTWAWFSIRWDALQGLREHAFPRGVDCSPF